MNEIITEPRKTGTMSVADVVALWERVLEFTPIDPEDNFFDLGGDSLLALQLFHSIERVTGVDFPITAIYEASTPTLLAALLDQVAPAPFSPLVLLKPGIGEPLFIAHGIGGNVVELQALGRLIDNPRPVYAIQAQGVDGASEPLDRVEDMVELYLTALRGVQPRGPYFLSGHSFGGLIAMELARRLRADGETVSLVAFFDSFAHPDTFSKSTRHLIRLRVALSAFRTMPFREACRFVLAKLKSRRANDAALLLANFPAAGKTEALRKTHDAAWRALLNYRPLPYAGDIVFFRPRTSIFPVAPARIWRRLTGGIALHRVPGTHDSMVREDVGFLAAALSRVLREAGSR